MKIFDHYFSAYACCRARTAECLSCIKGQSISEYCRDNPGTVGCPGILMKNEIDK